MAIGFHLDDIEKAHFSDPQKMYELNKQLRDLKKQLKTARVEAIKEFLQKARERSYESSDWSHSEHPFVVEWDDLVEIYEEMEERVDG